MKKTLTFFAATLLCALLAGCGSQSPNEPDDPKATETVQNKELKPVAVNEEITAFFETYLPELLGDNPVCLTINSSHDWRVFAAPNIKLPEIDFEDYTLVLGCHQEGNRSHFFKDQTINAEPDVMILTLVYEQMEGIFPTDLPSFYYWGLYPKLPKKEIEANVTII